MTTGAGMPNETGEKSYAYTTTDKSEVDVPEWAEGYEVGDLIPWEHPQLNDTQESEIVGFSTRHDGYPVIDGSDTPFQTPFVPETFAIDSDSHAVDGVDVNPELEIDKENWVDIREILP